MIRPIANDNVPLAPSPRLRFACCAINGLAWWLVAYLAALPSWSALSLAAIGLSLAAAATRAVTA